MNCTYNKNTYIQKSTSVEMRRSWHYDSITMAFREKGRENIVGVSAAVSILRRREREEIEEKKKYQRHERSEATALDSRCAATKHQ